MRARAPELGWLVGDVTDLRGAVDTASVDLVVDKGTFAALLEHSAADCGAGFGEARRVLRPGGHLLTISLMPLPARRLEATGFTLEATYRLPAISAGACDPSREVFAQVAMRTTDGDVHDAQQLRPSAFVYDGADYRTVADAVELPLLAATCEDGRG